MSPTTSSPHVDEPRFVFRGTVQKVRASIDSALKASPRTAIVRVDEVVRAPEALAELAGHEVTVELGGRDKLAAGAQAMFFAHGWIFGDSVAVFAVDHPPVEAAHVAMAAVPGDPVTNLANQDAKSRFDSAAVVISGQVVSVAMPANGHAKLASTNGEPLSEHVPIWREAVIDVHAVHKGRYTAKRAVVRFPASTDVLWHQSPKFHAGQQGFFLLHRDEPAAKSFGARAVAPPVRGMFTALHPADYQSFDQPSGIRALVDATAPNGRASGRRR